MIEYRYKILKYLIEHDGKADIVPFINEQATDTKDEIHIKSNIADIILKMSEPPEGLIEGLLQTQQAVLAGNYMNMRGRIFDEEEPIVISITNNGKDEYYKLDNRYNPPPIIPQQNTYISTSGPNSPAALNLNMRDIKINEIIPARKQNKFVAFLKKYWWGFLIPIIIGIILLAIEYGWFAKEK